MNKKIVTVIIAVLVLGFGAAAYFNMNRSAPPPQAVYSNQPVTSEEVSVNCQDQGLPEGSYQVSGGACTFTDEHYNRIMALNQQEETSGDESQLAYIKNVYLKSGDIYIDADYFQWLSSGDGSCVSSPDYSPTNNPSKPPCNPNGFFILNDNPRIRTFKLSPEVKIRLLEEYGTIPDLNALTPQDFLNKTNKFSEKYYVYNKNVAEPVYIPFRLIMKNGEILFIHQIYTP